MDPSDRLQEPDLVNRTVECPSPQITRIAVPQALLQHDFSTLADVFEWYGNIDTFFIIINTPPDIQSGDNDTGVQRRWELKSTGVTSLGIMIVTSS